jgi:hypothetical protein
MLTQIFVPKDQFVAAVFLSMVGKLAVTVSYGVIYIFSAELFPTEVRTIGMGACSMAARDGRIHQRVT